MNKSLQVVNNIEMAITVITVMLFIFSSILVMSIQISLNSINFVFYAVYTENSKLKILEVLQEKTVVINADDSLMLQCFLRKGILNHRNLAWYKDGRKLDVSNSTTMSILREDLNTSKLLGDVDQREIILKIKNATTTDSGSYACRASNDVNKTVKVTVKGRVFLTCSNLKYHLCIMVYLVKVKIYT